MLATYSLIKGSKKGFSLTELVIVVALAAIAMTAFLSYRPVKKVSLPATLEQINTIVQRACTGALLTQKIHQLRFFFDENTKIISIGYAPVNSIENVAQEKIPQSDKYPIKDDCIATHLTVDGNNELSKSRILETYILIYPEGYTQEVELGLKSLDGSMFITAVLNPFLGIFQMKELA